MIAIFFGAVWTYAMMRPGLLAANVDRQAALRAWPRFSVGSVGYLACITRQPAAGARPSA